jgi:hypothetical protein
MRLIVQAPLPGIPRPPGSLPPDVQVWRDNAGRVAAYSYGDGEHWVVDIPGLAAFRFAGEGNVVVHPQPGARRCAIRDFYRRCVRPMVLQSRGTEVLHASAVAANGGIVGLCGESESGKSTLAVALGLRGYAVWADDTVAFRVREDGIVAIPMGFSIRLRPPSASYFSLGQAESDMVVRVDGFPRARGVRPLAALCVLAPGPDLPGPRIHVAPLEPAQAFVALLSHAFCLSLNDVRRKTGMLYHYLELACRVPAFQIRFRAGFDSIGAVLDNIEGTALRAPISHGV